MLARVAALLTLVVLSASGAAHAARGDRSRDRALGDALVRGFTVAHYASKSSRKLGPTLPVVRHAPEVPYPLAAVEAGQGRHVSRHRVTPELTVGHDAWSVERAVATLSPKQRARLDRKLASGGEHTLTWSSRIVPFYLSGTTFPVRRHAQLPAALKASQTLTFTARGGAEHTVQVRE